MSARLRGVLSAEGAELYEELLRCGGIALDEASGPVPEPAQELIEHGFARRRHVGRESLVAVDPARAIDNAILVSQRRITEHYENLVALRDDMDDLRRIFVSGDDPGSGDSPEDVVRVLTDPAEIGALSGELALSARHDVAILETAHVSAPPDPRSVRTPPAEPVARGVEFRTIYERAVLEQPNGSEIARVSVESGRQCRVAPALPMRMVLVDDRAALLPTNPSGTKGAVLVRAPVIVAALRMYFDMLWHRSTPISSEEPVSLTRAQHSVLSMLVTGLTDSAISRSLGVSERTVRRTVSSLFELAAVDNRVALAVAAIREGWIA